MQNRKFIAIEYNSVLQDNGKFIKEFQKFVDSNVCELSIFQDGFDRMISDVLFDATEAYFMKDECVGEYEEDVVEVLSRIWANRELYSKIKKIMLNALFDTIVDYEKEL